MFAGPPGQRRTCRNLRAVVKINLVVVAVIPLPGNVVVMVNHNDYYNVELVNNRGRSIKLVEDIFVGDLVGVIDGLVEKTDDYEKSVRESLSL